MSFGVSAGSVPADPSFAPLVFDSSISQASPLLFQAAAAGDRLSHRHPRCGKADQRRIDRLRGVDAQQRRGRELSDY